MSRMPRRVAESVVARAAGNCEVMNFPSCNGRAEHLHHRKLRSQGGGHEVANLLHVCRGCHDWIHHNPGEAYRMGWLVKSGHDPATTEVAYRNGRKRLLSDVENVQVFGAGAREDGALF